MPSIDYAFTITLKPFMRRFSNTQQHDITSTWIRSVFQQDIGVANVTMIAELTQSHDVHYHGIISFDPNVKYHMNYWYDLWRPKGEPKLDMRRVQYCTKQHIGFTNIKPIEDYSGWLEYLCKDFHRYQEITDRRPIIHDDNDVFDSEMLLLNIDHPHRMCEG